MNVKLQNVENENEIIPIMEIKTRISNLQVRKEGEAVSFEIGENRGKENAINIKKV